MAHKQESSEYATTAYQTDSTENGNGVPSQASTSAVGGESHPTYPRPDCNLKQQNTSYTVVADRQESSECTRTECEADSTESGNSLPSQSSTAVDGDSTYYHPDTDLKQQKTSYTVVAEYATTADQTDCTENRNGVPFQTSTTGDEESHLPFTRSHHRRQMRNVAFVQLGFDCSPLSRNNQVRPNFSYKGEQKPGSEQKMSYATALTGGRCSKYLRSESQTYKAGSANSAISLSSTAAEGEHQYPSPLTRGMPQVRSENLTQQLSSLNITTVRYSPQEWPLLESSSRIVELPKPPSIGSDTNGSIKQERASYAAVLAVRKPAVCTSQTNSAGKKNGMPLPSSAAGKEEHQQPLVLSHDLSQVRSENFEQQISSVSSTAVRYSTQEWPLLLSNSGIIEELEPPCPGSDTNLLQERLSYAATLTYKKLDETTGSKSQTERVGSGIGILSLDSAAGDDGRQEAMAVVPEQQQACVSTDIAAVPQERWAPPYSTTAVESSLSTCQTNDEQKASYAAVLIGKQHAECMGSESQTSRTESASGILAQGSVVGEVDHQCLLSPSHGREEARSEVITQQPSSGLPSGIMSSFYHDSDMSQRSASYAAMVTGNQQLSECRGNQTDRAESDNGLLSLGSDEEEHECLLLSSHDEWQVRNERMTQKTDPVSTNSAAETDIPQEEPNLPCAAAMEKPPCYSDGEIEQKQTSYATNREMKHTECVGSVPQPVVATEDSQGTTPQYSPTSEDLPVDIATMTERLLESELIQLLASNNRMMFSTDLVKNRKIQILCLLSDVVLNHSFFVSHSHLYHTTPLFSEEAEEKDFLVVVTSEAVKREFRTENWEEEMEEEEEIEADDEEVEEIRKEGISNNTEEAV